MASLMAKTMSKLSIGAQVELTYGDGADHYETVRGIISDSDFSQNVEITLQSGETMVLNYALVRSLQVLSETVKPEEKVHKPAERKKALYLQSPEDILNAGDSRLKEIFDAMPWNERKLLSGIYDRFKYGIKSSDREKMTFAANQARQLIFQEDEKGYCWSREAVYFCGHLLRRVNVYDYRVYLVGECFAEAAVSCWREGKHMLAGAYALLSLLSDGKRHTSDMVLVAASGIVKAEDASGLRIFAERLPEGMEDHLKTLIGEAFSARGIDVRGDQDAAAALTMLDTLYPNRDMAEEVTYWLPREQKADSKPPVKSADPVKPVEPEYVCGVISRLNWSEKTGMISGEDGGTYSFRYKDILDTAILEEVQECLRADLNGKKYMVRFVAEGNGARSIRRDDTMVERARAIAADATREDRFERAFALCRNALETSDIRRALADLVKHAIRLHSTKQQLSYIKEAVEMYEKYITYYPNNAFAVLDIALCYCHLKKYPMMMEHAEKASVFPGLDARQRLAILTSYLKMMKEYYEVSGDKSLLVKILEKTDSMKDCYSRDFALDTQVRSQYEYVLLPYRVMAQCGLDMLEAAEMDYAQVPRNISGRAELDALMEKTRQRLLPPVAPNPEPVSQEEPAPQPELPEPSGEPEYEESPEELYAAPSEEEEDEEEISPYQDTDGWDALKLTKKEVIVYALNITGPNRIPAILAYLRAGSALNSRIGPVYHTVALAANDPMDAPDYSITALVNALAGSDTDYHLLNDFCMAAAFLRSSFLSGRGYDYSAQGLRDSIAVTQQLPALRDAYNTLEEFRKEAGRAIDIYADYRNHGVKKLKEDLDAAVRRADELYTKFVLMPAREGVKFARLLETKKIVFARDGYLASMLQHIVNRDQEALEAEKENFSAVYLNGTGQFSAKHISDAAVDKTVTQCWELAGKNMQMKKLNATLQGDRRNNLRSNISDVLRVICQWYALSEQSAGLTWRTEQGEQAYLRLRPQLLQQLSDLSRDCLAEMESCPDPEQNTGLFLLSAAAQELSARLDGSWRFEQEKYLYADFLRSNHIMLNADFMPELTSTFCVLPEFNILARIRQHVEGEKLSFQEQIHRIYGTDKSCNNYGTGERIVEYLQAMGDGESVTLPENPERFLSYTQMQIDMRCRSFRETYALAMNYGQIIKSDAFCYTLEDTVRYWHAFCKTTKNYGFFTSILLQAENQIHASARQYEMQLDEQLDALIASNRQYFSAHPDYAEAIRMQISNQNFTVAEDWMARIRIGDFSLDVQKPEALGYLEGFWNSYADTYGKVFDASRPLSALLGRREVRNKDTKRAQQLIDNWLHNGRPSNSERIEQLLNLLGWQNIRVKQYQLPTEQRTEIYEVHKASSAADLTTPQHPIAAYGSNLEKKQMYVVCLYGTYDCERIYEKMRALDVIDGNKIFLVDYAIGQSDRRALACKLKKRESGLRSVNMVIDRMLITYLANHYNENLINRILMATAMPFSYCQPYVVESAHTMPPEIFIGRKDELLKIEQADGVNLIFGGRQLGKSALFKKALSDIDGRQQKRAVLIDIKELDCAAAARKISTKLIDLNITPDAQVTDDWDVLCRNIELRLRREDNEIKYFLLMLDEADTFISDCARCGYHPLVALKDVQQSLPGRFKYVLAGLHNIVKFNRQVALGNNSVITHMPSLKITPFHTPEAQELLTYPLSYLGFSLPSKVTVSQILATCNYFPGLIQLYAKKLIESIRAGDYAGYDIKKTPPYVISDEHLRRVMSDKEFVDQIHEKFEITLTLDQDQGSCYYPLTLLIGWMYNVAPSKNGYTARDVLYHAKDLSVYPLADLDTEKIDALLQELQDLNILRSVSNNSYLLASKNFRDLLGSDEEIFEKLMKVGGVAV